MVEVLTMWKWIGDNTVKEATNTDISLLKLGNGYFRGHKGMFVMFEAY